MILHYARSMPVTLLLVTLVLFPLAGNCQEAKGDPVGRALKLSGIAAQTQDLTDTLLSIIPKDAFSKASEARSVESEVRKAASEDQLLSVVQDAIKEEMNREYLAKVLEFYETPLGRKIGRLTGSALRTSRLLDVREGRKLMRNMPDERRKIVERIVEREKPAEFCRWAIATFVRGVLEGSRSALGAQPAIGAEEKLDSILGKLDVKDSNTRSVALTAFANTFHDVSDDQLKQYDSFLQTEPAKWFRDSAEKGLNRSVYVFGLSLGKAMANVSLQPRN